MRVIKAFLFFVIVAVLGGVAFVYSGAFEAGADVPHSPIVSKLLRTARDRSIEVRAKDIQVPNLDDQNLIADGAGHYSEMCTGCHLAPGKKDTEIRRGLYPQPPNLTETRNVNPAETFWTIKHGIKMSAMPAWGATHDDQAIWGIVAFLRKLPGMTPEQYQAMTKSSSEDEGGHHHHHGEGDSADGSDQHDHGGNDEQHAHHDDAGGD